MFKAFFSNKVEKGMSIVKLSTLQSEQLYTQQSGERKDDFYERFLWNNGFVLPGIKALIDLSLPKMYLSTQTF